MHRVSATAVAAALLLLMLPYPSSAQQAPVKIGVVFAVSGAHAALGKSITTTIAAWLAQHKNLAGGRPVEIILRDDSEQPETAKRLATELVIQDKVDFLVGANTTPQAMALEGVSTTAKVPLFIVNSNNEGITNGAPYAVRFSPTWKDLVLPLARRAIKDGAKTAYTVSVDIASGRAAQQVFADTFTAGGGKMVGSLAVPMGTTDWSSFMLRIRDEKPQAIFMMAAGGPTAIAFVKALALNGLRPATKVYATADLTAEEALPPEGDDSLGIVTSSNYTPSLDSTINRAFVKTYLAQVANPTQTDLPNFMDAQLWTILTAIDKVVAAQSGPLDLTKTMATLRGLALETPQGPVVLDPQTRDLKSNIYLRRTEKRNGIVTNVIFDTFTLQQAQ